ncbi:MAG TPA: polysaccharide biosynthesis tyrosine autokinase [Pirellulales bacterium]|nr:polysaccharide biosynthesis tyrosine autokinase [Pirellulales bacterium]
MASDTQAPNTPNPEVPENRNALVAMGDRVSNLPAVPWPYGAQVAVRPEILSASPTPVDLFQALRRRWTLAIGLGMVLSGILASLVWLLVPVRYETQALIKVSKVLPVVLQNVQPGQEEAAAYEIYKKTQLQLIKSNFVLSRAARKPDMQDLVTIKEHKEDPVGFLEAKLQVDYPGDAELMRIALKGTHREELAKIVNAVVDSYMDEIVSGDKVTRLKQRDLLNQNFSANQEKFRQQHDKYKKLAAELGANSSEAAQLRKRMADGRLQTLMNSYGELQRRIQEQQTQIRVLKERKENSKEDATPASEHLMEAEFARDPIISDLTKQLNLQRLQIKDAKSRLADPNSYWVKELKRQLATLEEQIQERRLEIQPEVAERVNSAASMGGSRSFDPDTMLPMLETENRAMQERLTLMQEDLDKQLKAYGKLDVDTADLSNQESSLDDLKQIIKRVGMQLSYWTIELEAEQRIRVMDQASRPQGDDSLQKYLAVGFAGLVGFGVVLFGVAYIEFQSRRLNSVSEVKEGLGLPVIGELPTLSGRTWRKIRSGSPAGVALEALLSESIDSIRTRLLHTSGIESPRVVMVTSADPREGKTTLAIQLATSLARSGRRTLLIDGDVRNPTIHRVFELALDPGLCEILRGDVERAVALQPSRTAQLWVLAAGRCCLQSVQALSQTALHDLLATLRNEFEFIVIDSSPVLKLADPLLFGQHVDVALLSVLRDISKTPQIYEAAERLKSVGITVLGTVVNGVNDRAQHYAVHQLALPDKAGAPS